MNLESQDIRRLLLKIEKEKSIGHVGSSLSCVDIVHHLYLDVLGKEDKFVLSKGHGVLALYTILHQLKGLKLEDIPTVGHADSTSCPMVHWSTGALGHGISVGAGMALANKSRKVCVLSSDGDLNQGSSWEALFFAQKQALDNLHIYVDQNSLQAFAKEEDVLCLSGKFQGILEALGAEVKVVDGHNLEDLKKSHCEKRNGKVKVYICKTIKGKGIESIEGKIESHYHSVR